MLTVDQILENNSEENDMYIATYGKQQFDELMRLLETQDFKWAEGQMPTDDYEDIIEKLGKLFDTKNPYQFANVAVLLVALHYTNKRIACSLLLPEIEYMIDNYERCFGDYETTKMIKPYLLLKKEIEQACDFEG